MLVFCISYIVSYVKLSASKMKSHVDGIFFLLNAASHSVSCISILTCRLPIKDKECRVHADMLFLTPALRPKNCCTVHMDCKITAWLGTSCQETICVTAFNTSLFFSPYAYVMLLRSLKTLLMCRQYLMISLENSLPFYFW